MPHKEKRLTDAKAAAEEADFRVFQTHHGGSHDTEGFASLHPRLRATRSARAFDLSGRTAAFILPQISTEFGGFSHYCSNLCPYFVLSVFIIAAMEASCGCQCGFEAK